MVVIHRNSMKEFPNLPHPRNASLDVFVFYSELKKLDFGVDDFLHEIGSLDQKSQTN
jgi:hypothetical protein